MLHAFMCTHPAPAYTLPSLLSGSQKEGREPQNSSSFKMAQNISTSLGALSLNPVPPVSQADASSVWVSLKKYWPDPNGIHSTQSRPKGALGSEFSPEPAVLEITHLTSSSCGQKGKACTRWLMPRAVILLPANLQGKQRWREE